MNGNEHPDVTSRPTPNSIAVKQGLSEVELLAERRHQKYRRLRDAGQLALAPLVSRDNNLVNKSLRQLKQEGIENAGVALRTFPLEVFKPFRLKRGLHNTFGRMATTFLLSGGVITGIGAITEAFILYGGSVGTLTGVGFLIALKSRTKNKKIVEARERLTSWLQEQGLIGFTVTDSDAENMLHSDEAFQLVLKDEKQNQLYINSDGDKKFLNRGRLVLAENANSKPKALFAPTPILTCSAKNFTPVTTQPELTAIQSISLQITDAAAALLAMELPVEYRHAAKRAIADVRELNRLYEKNNKSVAAETISFDSLIVLAQEMDSLTADSVNLGMREMKAYQTYIQQRQSGFTLN